MNSIIYANLNLKALDNKLDYLWTDAIEKNPYILMYFKFQINYEEAKQFHGK